MKTWLVTIGIIVIVAFVCSSAAAIGKSDLIAQYKGQSAPTIPTPTVTSFIPSRLPEWWIPENANVDPAAMTDDTPSSCPENLASCPSVQPYFGPVEIVDPLHLRIQWNVSAFLPKLLEQNGPCYKSDPLSPICSPIKFVDDNINIGVKVE
jgi:hypothetical protein